MVPSNKEVLDMVEAEWRDRFDALAARLAAAESRQTCEGTKPYICHELATARARLAEAERDAARYRWLSARINWRDRKTPDVDGFPTTRWREWVHDDYRENPPALEHIDEYIDSQRATDSAPAATELLPLHCVHGKRVYERCEQCETSVRDICDRIHASEKDKEVARMIRDHQKIIDAKRKSCPKCYGTGAIDAPTSADDPSCPDCDGEGHE